MLRSLNRTLAAALLGVSFLLAGLQNNVALAQSTNAALLRSNQLPAVGDTLVAIADVQTLSGDAIASGSTVEVVAIIEVAKDIAPSGYLLNFKSSSGVNVADLAGFVSATNGGNYYISPVTSSDRDGSAEVCLTVRGAVEAKDPDLQGLALENFVDVQVGEKRLDAFSVRVPSQPSWRVDNTFCVSGLPYSESVSITLKPGVQPNDGGDSFTAKLEAKLTTAAMMPRISLDAGKNILPLTAEAVLPISVVNVPKINIEVFRIDPRTISETTKIFSAQDGGDVEAIAFRYGESLGSFPINIPSELNVPATYNLQLDRALKLAEPGLFVAIFDAEALELSRYEQRPTQWFMRSNLSLISYSGLTETELVIADFETLETIYDAEVEIIAANNRVLFFGTSDVDGTVTVPQSYLAGRGGHAPEYVFVHSNNDDFALLEASNLKKRPSAFMGGTDKVLAEDTYLTLAREMVRPGEQLDFHAAIRSLDLSPLKEFAVDAVLIDQDGEEAATLDLQTNAFGMLAGSFSGASHQKLGRYAVELRRRDDVVLARTEFKVDDFVPLTIEATLLPDQSVWTKSAPLNITLEAEYFSGGPAAGLFADIRYELRKTRSIKGLEGYVFGAVDIATANDKLPQREFTLNEQGQIQDRLIAADFSGELHGLQELVVRGDVFDAGGRPNPVRMIVPVDSASTYIGIRPEFDGYLAIGRAPSFMISTVDRTGQQVGSGEINLTVERLNYRYNWYYDDGWRWRRYLDTTAPVDSTKVQQGFVTLGKQLDWGLYRLTASDATGAVTEYEFSVGWGGDGSLSAEPSELVVFVDPASENASKTLRLKAPFDGQLRIQVAAEDVLSSTIIAVEKGDVEVQVDLPVEREPGVNVLVTLVRPVERGTEHLPQIALGRTWVENLSPNRKLMIDVQTAQKIRSDEQIAISFETNATGTAQFFLVDEGIHALTGFQNKSPQGHFFGERAASVGFTTNFGRLMNQDDSLTAFRVGGDAWLELSRVAQKSNFFKTVFRASPIIDVQTGLNTYSFDPAEMEGRLRLVAFVATERGVGFSEVAVQVQDPISMDVSLPRFVATGDRVEGKLTLRGHVTSIAELTYAVNGQKFVTDISLSKGQSLDKAINFHPQEVGNIPVKIRLKTSEMDIVRDYEIVAREPSYPHYEAKSFQLSATNRSYRVPALALEDFSITAQRSLQLKAALSPVSGAGMSQVAEALDRYPYGCIEQTSSTTRGLIFRAELLRSVDEDQRKKINQGIMRILSMQKRDGSFGYWSSKGQVVEEYQPYALETLLYALDYADQPELVKTAIQKGLDYLEIQLFEDLWTQAYAFGVLAKSGREVKSRARYFIDMKLLNEETLAWITEAEKVEDASGAYWLARLIGDTRRANKAAEHLGALSVRRASATGDLMPASWESPSQPLMNVRASERFGALLSDPALQTVPESVVRIRHATAAYLAGKRYRSTMENAKLAQIFAAQKTEIAGTEVLINGVLQRVSSDGSLGLSADMLAQGFLLETKSPLSGYLNVEAVGTRSSSRPVENGFRVNKEIYDADGNLIYSDANECPFDNEQICSDAKALCERGADADGFRKLGLRGMEIQMRNLDCGRFSPKLKDTVIPAKYSGVGNALSAVQGDLFTTVIRVERLENWVLGDLMITDLLPSGFELEDGTLSEPMLKDMGGAYSSVLPKDMDEPIHVQKMDDRFSAHFQVSLDRQQQLITYYVMRAVNPGLVTVPDAHAELMYQPSENGRSGMGSADIAVKR